MPVIKRYANRKLYDTDANQYVNLGTIANMIRNGDHVQVIDNVTGEDLTAVTLTQIIMEREKNDGNFLPLSILSTLIKVGGESLNTIQQKLGSPSNLIQQVDKEIDDRLQWLIQRGEIAEEAGKKLRDQLIERGNIWSNLFWFSDDDLEKTLKNYGVPSGEDFKKLGEQINALAKKVDKLHEIKKSS